MIAAPTVRNIASAADVTGGERRCDEQGHVHGRSRRSSGREVHVNYATVDNTATVADQDYVGASQLS